MRRLSYLLYLTVVGNLSCHEALAAVVFEPGIGLGLEYTDNARLSPEEPIEDLITAGYIGARVSENDGSLKYDASASLNKHNYVRDSYDDQRYFNMIATADWEMIQERFNWFLSNRYSQLPVFTVDSNTPDNIQDSNVFNVGADIRFPISARQSFSLVPSFSQYYFEVLLTDSKQYALSADWNYQMYRLTNIGLSLSARKINYTETDPFGQSIEDTVFTSLGLTFNGQRLRSNFTGSLGATNVERENGDETTGFTGFVNWLADLTTRSKFETLVSTDLTDTSSVALSTGSIPVDESREVQVTTDVIRNSIVNLAYKRDDASLRSSVSARYHKLTYSDSPLDQAIRSFGARVNHPVTQLLTSGVYADYNRREYIDTEQLDKYYTVGGNMRYRFSRKLNGLFDLKYRNKESTSASQNYEEISVFVSLVYGFGDVLRPTRR